MHKKTNIVRSQRLVGTIILLLLLSQLTTAMAQSYTLYAVTRSTRTFRLKSQQNPTIGLFATRDRGKSWRHYGWEAGKAFSVAVDVSRRPPILYIACGNGVHRSADGGKRFAILTDHTMTECLRVAVDPRHPDTLYVASAYGIFRSRDGGRTWQAINRGLTSTFTPTVVIDARDSRRLFCATEAGIHRSTDGGEHWEPVGLLGLGIRTLMQHPTTPDMWLAGTEHDGIFVSLDGGRTWEARNEGLEHRTVYALAAASNDPLALYAGTFQGGVYKCKDGGRTWHPASGNLPNRTIHALAVDPQDADVVYAGTLNDGVWMSTDGGASWRCIGLETSQVWDLLIVR